MSIELYRPITLKDLFGSWKYFFFITSPNTRSRCLGTVTWGKWILDMDMDCKLFYGEEKWVLLM